MKCAGAGTLMVALYALGGTAAAQERKTPVVPERPARVQIIAGFDDKCQATPAAVITVTVVPAKGAVSLRAGQETRIASSKSGTCIGERISGTGVYYTARAGATGSDSFAISAKLATGEEMVRSFTVEIAE